MPLHVILIFGLLLGNVLLRTFTNELHVLPKLFNVFDLAVVAWMLLLGFARNSDRIRQPWVQRISRRLFWFCLVLVIGAALNPAYFLFEASLSQMVMLVAPLALFLAIDKLPTTAAHVATYTRLLQGLIVLELIIGLLQLPGRILIGDSELVHGTFPGNAEQYASFLMIAIFFCIAKAILNPNRSKRYWLVVVLVLLLDISIDNKASWLGTVVSLAVVLHGLGILRISRSGWVGALVLVGLLGAGLAFIASKTSTTLYKFELINEAIRTGQVMRLGKIKAFSDIFRSHFQSPHMLLVGAGPSTFYSRSSRQFFLLPGARASMYLNPTMIEQKPSAAADGGAASDSMGGYLQQSLLEPYYTKFYGSKDLIFAVGSIQVDSPFSSVIGILGETGFLGAYLYFSCYLFAFRFLLQNVQSFRYDSAILPLMTSALGLLIYLAVNSLYGPHLETTRMTTILWSMIALAAGYVKKQQVTAEQRGSGFDHPQPSAAMTVETTSC